LRVVGGLVLIALGVRGLLSLRSPRADGESSEAVIEAAAPGHRRTYLELLGLTLLNPATIVYFAAVTVGLPAGVLDGVPQRIAFAAAAFAASLSWQIGLAVFGAILGRGLGHRIHRPTVIIGNAIVIALGALILLEGLRPPAA
jgi:arginine exporter protein ArgO